MNKDPLIEIIERCEVKDTGNLSPEQAAQIMKEIIIGATSAYISGIERGLEHKASKEEHLYVV